MSSKLTSNFLQIKFAVGKHSKQGIYVFDEYRLDADTLMLYRRGEPLMLPPKVVKTLAVLIENCGEVISKDDLLEKVWDDSIVEESNLSQNLYILRKTLGPRPNGEAYIETFRRRGYRFTSENVTIEPQSVNCTRAEEPPQSPPRYSVERRGNVVALVDWKDAEGAEPKSADANPDKPALVIKRRPWRTYLFAVVLPVIFSLAALGLISELLVQVPPQARGALEIIYLTNGDGVDDATISRDGKYFTYHESDGELTRLVVQQTGQSQKLEILPKDHRLIFGKTFSPDSQYIYYAAQEASASHRSIYRVPSMGGVPVKIVEETMSYPSFAPDGKSMAFTRWNNEVSSLVIAQTDGTGEKTLLTVTRPEMIEQYPAWSPDGNLIAFGSVNAAESVVGTCTLAAYQIKTGTTKQLTTEKWDTCYRIEWTRDGKGIVFVGTKAGDGTSIRRDQVYHVSLASGESRRMTADASRNQPASLGVTVKNEILSVPFSRTSQLWVVDSNGSSKTAASITGGSSDGRSGLVSLPDDRIAYTSRVGENLSGWVINANGSDKRQLTSEPATIEELRATRDGKYFFFAAEVGDRTHLFRIDADGSDLKQITAGDTYETDSSLSPDGMWIVYHSATIENINKPTLWRSSINGGAPTQVSTINCFTPNYSPTGKFISCVLDQEAFVVSVEDGKLVAKLAVVKPASLNVGVKWTPDEKALVYIVFQKRGTNLWLHPLDGRPPRQLTDFPNGDIYNFAYSYDGSKVYLARGFQTRDAILIKGLE